MIHHNLRPCLSVQTARYLSTKSCIWLDGILTNHNGSLYFTITCTVAGDSATAQSFSWKLEKDSFGLFYDNPVNNALGVEIYASDLNGLNTVQYNQLARLMLLLAMYVRGKFEVFKRQSTCIHALKPRPGDPFDGLKNSYNSTARAQRDSSNSRRAYKTKAGKDSLTAARNDSQQRLIDWVNNATD